MIAELWPDWFKALYGGGWPTTYLAFDLETTGYSKSTDIVLEIGHCLVVDGQPTDRAGNLINWTADPRISLTWLKAKIAAINAALIDKTGHPFPITVERLADEGKSPREVMAFYADFFGDLRKKSVIFTGHGIVNFDIPFLEAFIERYSLREIEFPDNAVFDTALLEKANQLEGDNLRKAIPVTGDTLFDYFVRIKKMSAPGVLYNMGEHCFKKYNLDQFGVKKEELHGAGDDAYCVYLLMEVFRSQLEKVEPTEAQIAKNELPEVKWKVPIAEVQKNLKIKKPKEAPKPPPVQTTKPRIRGQRRS